MRLIGIVVFCFSLTSALMAYEAPLESLHSLACADKEAVRFDQGATTQGRTGGPTAFIKLVATGSESGNCDVRATVHVKPEHSPEKEILIGRNTPDEFGIVDWSPNADLVLMFDEHWTDEGSSAPLLTIYNIVLSTHHSINVGALFAAKGWIGCSAIIEASGFTASGEIVVSAGPGALDKRPKDCLADKSYWTFDAQGHNLRQLPAGFKQKRYGRVVSPEIRPCKEDPNVVDACFNIHGRMFASNGTPGLRVWRVGTDRILGVFDPENEIIPENLARKLSGFDVEVYGDFEVCPFTKQKDGAMQMVCVESASHLVAKHN